MAIKNRLELPEEECLDLIMCPYKGKGISDKTRLNEFLMTKNTKLYKKTRRKDQDFHPLTVTTARAEYFTNTLSTNPPPPPLQTDAFKSPRL
jgi:hypothetical protein